LPEEKEKDEEEKVTLIKSRDPHLAGGEKSEGINFASLPPE
jgi:hypothetical protein